METANKEIVEKKTYVHDENEKDYATKGTALGVGIPALVLGGLSALALWGRGNGFGFGGASVPENVNIGGIIRNGQGMVVSGSTIILPGDHVVIFCMATSIRKIAKFFNN